MLTYQPIGKGGFRLMSDSGRESLLSRYGILKNELRHTNSEVASLTLDGNTATLTGARREVTLTVNELPCTKNRILCIVSFTDEHE